MATSAIPTVLDHLVALFTAAPGLGAATPPVAIVDGPMPSSGPLPLALWVGVEDVIAAATGAVTTAADNQEQRIDFGGVSRAEDITVYCVAGAYSGGSGGFKALRASVAGITAAVETAVQADVPNPYQNPGVTNLTWQQIAYSDGLQLFVPFRIIYKAFS
jgi:hypothetical protein